MNANVTPCHEYDRGTVVLEVLYHRKKKTFLQSSQLEHIEPRMSFISDSAI